MRGFDRLENAEWLELFSRENSSDITFSLYNNLTSDEDINKFWEKCSDLYYFSCFPFDESLEKWREVPDVYQILKQFAHTANGHPLDILICKYDEESMQEARKMTEEFRKKYEGTNVTIKDPNGYVYMVWFFWGSAWRTAQYLIRELKEKFPDKFRDLKVR